jgi:hypothetical protein
MNKHVTQFKEYTIKYLNGFKENINELLNEIRQCKVEFNKDIEIL